MIYNFVLTAHTQLGLIYKQNKIPLIHTYASIINQQEIDGQHVIAINEEKVYNLNYLTNKSFVIFNPATIENLIEENNLQTAFDQFNVKYIVGYSDELAQKIIEQSNVENLASDSVEIKTLELSNTKKQFLNFFR